MQLSKQRLNESAEMLRDEAKIGWKGSSRKQAAVIAALVLDAIAYAIVEDPNQNG